METKEVAIKENSETGPSILPVEKVVSALNAVQDLKARTLREGIDFGQIPTVDKPCLFKPGMEKLCMMFNMAPDYVTISRSEDYEKQWSYSFTVNKNGNKTTVTKQSTGFYSYEVQCRLISKNSGMLVASGLGQCNSRERGRESAPANTILKMACKRAFGLAIQNATMSSQIFTVDVDDLDPSQISHNNYKSNNSPDENGIEREIASKLDNSVCKICGKRHIKIGTTIVMVGGKWVGAKECYLKTIESIRKKVDGDPVQTNLQTAEEVPPPNDDDLPFNNF